MHLCTRCTPVYGARCTVHTPWKHLPATCPENVDIPRSNLYRRAGDYGYSVEIDDVSTVLSEEGRFGTGSGPGFCISMYDSFKIEFAYKDRMNNIIVDVDAELTEIPSDMSHMIGFSGMYCFFECG